MTPQPEFTSAGLVVLGALAVRLLFVWWAPSVPVGDGLFYEALARAMARGQGYLSMDGSPGILWPPGWPAVMAALYVVFGESPRLVLLLNALLGGLTTFLIYRIGSQCSSRRAALAGAGLFAVWPGNVYYCATYFTETAFNTLLTSVLWCLLRGGSLADARERRAWVALGGLLFGASALVKAEPLVLMPFFVGFLCFFGVSRVEGVKLGVLFLVLTLLTISPWTLRNYRVFGRLIPTSASGGMNLYVGNHPGASGKADYLAMIRYVTQHRGKDFAETVIAGNRAGYRDAWDFVTSRPSEAGRLMLRKVKHSWVGDGEAVWLISGAFEPQGSRLAEGTLRRLLVLADGFWFALFPLLVLGAMTMSSWRRDGQALVLSVLIGWTIIQMVVFGGERFHVPQTPSLALVAGAGLVALLDALARPTLLPDGMTWPWLGRFSSENWQVLILALLILLCVLLAPEVPLKFIYTEF